MQITVEKPPPIACTKRSHCTCSTVVANAIASDASVKISEADEADALAADLIRERAAEELADPVADEIDADRVVDPHDADVERRRPSRASRAGTRRGSERADRDERADEQDQMARDAGRQRCARAPREAGSW